MQRKQLLVHAKARGREEKETDWAQTVEAWLLAVAVDSHRSCSPTHSVFSSRLRAFA